MLEDNSCIERDQARQKLMAQQEEDSQDVDFDDSAIQEAVR